MTNISFTTVNDLDDTSPSNCQAFTSRCYYFNRVLVTGRSNTKPTA